MSDVHIHPVPADFAKDALIGKAKYEELARASDEEFDELWDKTKENWHALSSGIEHGWDTVSDKVRSFFS